MEVGHTGRAESMEGDIVVGHPEGVDAHRITDVLGLDKPPAPVTTVSLSVNSDVYRVMRVRAQLLT